MSGAFRVVRGTAATVDAAEGTLTVDTGARGAPRVSVVIGPETLVRQLPPPMVARLLSGAAPDPDEALERLPAATLDRVQKGAEVAAPGPKEGDPGVLAAIKRVAWVVPRGAAGRSARRDRGGSGEGQAHPFADLLDLGGGRRVVKPRGLDVAVVLLGLVVLGLAIASPREARACGRDRGPQRPGVLAQPGPVEGSPRPAGHAEQQRLLLVVRDLDPLDEGRCGCGGLLWNDREAREERPRTHAQE